MSRTLKLSNSQIFEEQIFKSYILTKPQLLQVRLPNCCYKLRPNRWYILCRNFFMIAYKSPWGWLDYVKDLCKIRNWSLPSSATVMCMTIENSTRFQFFQNVMRRNIGKAINANMKTIQLYWFRGCIIVIWTTRITFPKDQNFVKIAVDSWTNEKSVQFILGRISIPIYWS